MTKVIANKSANSYVVQFEDGKTYGVLVEQVGNRLEAFEASSHTGPSRCRTYNLDRHAKLLGRLSDAINS